MMKQNYSDTTTMTLCDILLCFLISNVNGVHGSKQLQFRAVYAVYQANPCAEGADEYLRKAVQKIQDYELQTLEIQKQILNQLYPGVKGTDLWNLMS
jgi:hypothetical protein